MLEERSELEDLAALQALLAVKDTEIEKRDRLIERLRQLTT